MAEIRNVVITLALLLGGCASAPETRVTFGLGEDAPLKISLIKRRRAKFPYHNYFFSLKLHNSSRQPAWFIVRYRGDQALQRDGVFHNPKPYQQPFKGKKFDGGLSGGKGVAIRVDFMGRQPFSAFYLPAQAKIEFAEFVIISPLNFEHFELWKASKIWVDNDYNLEKWLPYKPLCDREVFIPADAGHEDLDWDSKRMGSRKDYPYEKVQHVWVVAEQKWLLPVKY